MRSSIRALFFVAVFAAAGCHRDRFVFPKAPVILISVDTLRADHLPAYGYRGVATPNFDQLRKDSVLFANAYSHVPLTLPSHACLLTGLLPYQTGVRDNFGYKLPADIETLASFLRPHGYETGAAISAAVLARVTGMDRGFDFYDDAFERGQARRDGARSVDALSKWVASRRTEAWFAFLHLYEPHAPYQPPEPYRSRYPLAYDGTIARADELVGAFLEPLRRSGLYDRAVILFVSDHGEGLGEHGEQEHGVFLYREAIHVPIFLKLPGRVRPRETVSAVVGLTDIVPTVARLLGLPTPPGRAGVSLTDFLGNAPAPSRRIFSETEYPRLRLGWSDLASLVDERYQYIEAPKPELYDLSGDPSERTNLAPQLSAAFRSMRTELERIARPLDMPGKSDAEQTKKLVSLGYLSATSPLAGTKDLPDPKDRIGDLEGSLQIGRLQAQGKDAELIVACRTFLARNPAVLNVWELLANALEKTGRRPEAIAALREGLKSATSIPPALRVPAIEHLTYLLVQSGQVAEALALANPDSFTDTKALNALGVAQGNAGRFEEARQTFERVLRLDPGDASAHVNLGNVLMRLSQPQQARDHFAQAVQTDPQSAAAWGAWGDAKASLGDEIGAMECWKRALELDASAYNALYNLAIVEGRHGQVQDARRALERFVAHAPPAVFAKDLAEARRLLRSLGPA